mmetsp:Transcript_155829/g.283451  ORF Transcript_155829/g.283451 Transcript_155829/m.283451 type:complete len:205 (-) Transcript_155829:82-696(-)
MNVMTETNASGSARLDSISRWLQKENERRKQSLRIFCPSVMECPNDGDSRPLRQRCPPVTPEKFCLVSGLHAHLCRGFYWLRIERGFRDPPGVARQLHDPLCVVHVWLHDPLLDLCSAEGFLNCLCSQLDFCGCRWELFVASAWNWNCRLIYSKIFSSAPSSLAKGRLDCTPPYQHCVCTACLETTAGRSWQYLQSKHLKQRQA